MAFTIDGTDVQNITIDGKTCTDVMIGSTHVWCTKPLSKYYNIIKSGTSSNYSYAISFYIQNTSKRAVTYTITYGGTSKTVLIAKEAVGSVNFDVDLAPMPNRSVRAQVEYLGCSCFISNTYNQTITLA